jgi:hypothetical protein
MRLILWQLLACLAVLAALSASSKEQEKGLTLLEKDLLCVCRHFNKRSNITSDGSDEFCDAVGFKHRWELLFPGRVELGVGIGGLRALVFRSRLGDKSNVIFAFRDFQHEKMDYYIDDDAMQELSYYGPEIWKQKTDNAFLQFLMGTVTANAMFYARHVLGFDYNKHASAFVDEVLSRGKPQRRAIFTGFGFGGSVATLQALRNEGSTGVVFEAHGVRDAAKFFGYRPVTRRVTNLVLGWNENKIMGEPSTVQCLFKANPLFTLLEEQHSVYSWSGFAGVDSQRECADPVE